MTEERDALRKLLEDVRRSSCLSWPVSPSLSVCCMMNNITIGSACWMMRTKDAHMCYMYWYSVLWVRDDITSTPTETSRLH